MLLDRCSDGVVLILGQYSANNTSRCSGHVLTNQANRLNLYASGSEKAIRCLAYIDRNHHRWCIAAEMEQQKQQQQQQQQQMIPPPNLGMVEPGLFRSGQPREEHLPFLKQVLQVRNVLCVCPDSKTSKQMFEGHGISFFQLGIRGKGTLQSSCGDRVEAAAMKRILQVLLDASNYPLLVHCNGGKHRCGRVVGCLRKVQKWPLETIFQEYRVFAGSKSRDLDESLIAAFEDDYDKFNKVV